VGRARGGCARGVDKLGLPHGIRSFRTVFYFLLFLFVCTLEKINHAILIIFIKTFTTILLNGPNFYYKYSQIF
jgi:hypothetical protein